MARLVPEKLKESVQDLERVEGRAGADTIRLWESYKDQAYLWRAIALLQMPTSALAILSALIMFFFADTILQVPDKPQPGYYSSKQLPDSQFINFSTELINLMTSYQFKTARNQFYTARKFLWEPALSEFERKMVLEELKAIEETSRSQLFFVNEKQIRIERRPEEDKVIVRLPGTRQKIIGKQAIEPEELAYYITMTTIPRNSQNEYGIVAINIQIRKISFRELHEEDWRAEKQREAELRESREQ